MGGEFIIDVPLDDIVHWFVGYGPGEVLGLCPHACVHRSRANIAWGSDREHYTLDECSTCHCRAWLSVDVVNGKPRPRFDEACWFEVRPDPAKIRRKAVSA